VPSNVGRALHMLVTAVQITMDPAASAAAFGGVRLDRRVLVGQD
jgi:hypothetical protein